MYRAIHHDGSRALIDMRDYLKRHDIVYKRPTIKAYEGLPIGTGSMGGLLFHTARGLLMQINHTDLIDFAKDGSMQAWAWEAEERQTAPLSLGELEITCNLPCFDWVYLEEYEERLNIGDGCIEGRAKTPFSIVEWKVYGLDMPEALIYEVKATLSEEASWSVKAERWPSPVFFHHYEQVLPIYDKNFDTVNAKSIEERLLLQQDLGRCKATLQVILEESGENKIVPELIHSRGGTFCTEKKKQHEFRVIVNATVIEAGNNSLKTTEEQCHSDLMEVICNKKSHDDSKESWHDFWKKSFVHIKDEEYLENLYYIYLYQLNCCSRGRYPVTFAGLWSWFKDTRNWGHFYHWNHQQTYWPVQASGHIELYRNYLEYRWNMLPKAEEDAKRLFGAKGAFYSDVSNLNGYNAIEPDTIRNCSVGAQIAMDFYRYYCYTQDKEFMRTRVIPMLCKSADFYVNMIVEEDGRLLIKGGSYSYESYWNLKETLTDYVSLKAVLMAIRDIEEVPKDKKEAYLVLEDKLQEPPTEQIVHNGENLKIYAAGIKWDGRIVHYDEGEYPDSPFPASLVSPVCPSECISLMDDGTEAFQIMRNTARVILDREVYRLGRLGCSGHTPAPQMAARLGLKDDMIRVLKKYAESYQIFTNGFMHFADISQNQQWSPIDRPRILSIEDKDTRWEELHNKEKGIRTAIPAEWFLHCYFEAAANLATGIQEMLLLSNNGIIRIFPALPDSQTAMFTLWARGGYLVTSEIVEGDVRYVEIYCKNDGICRIINPWKDDVTIQLKKMDEDSYTGVEVGITKSESSIIEFSCKAECRYMLFRSENPLESYYHNSFEFKKNNGIKKLGEAVIGNERYY